MGNYHDIDLHPVCGRDSRLGKPDSNAWRWVIDVNWIRFLKNLPDRVEFFLEIFRVERRPGYFFLQVDQFIQKCIQKILTRKIRSPYFWIPWISSVTRSNFAVKFVSPLFSRNTIDKSFIDGNLLTFILRMSCLVRSWGF